MGRYSLDAQSANGECKFGSRLHKMQGFMRKKTHKPLFVILIRIYFFVNASLYFAMSVHMPSRYCLEFAVSR